MFTSTRAGAACVIAFLLAMMGHRTSAQDVPREQQVERLFNALKNAVNEIPRDTFDPEAVLRQTGPDADRIFAWVRDQTTLVPYRGALRGSVGVLLDRFGNSLDRSLLLGDLLHRSKHEVRLARAELSAQQASEMLSSLRLPKASLASPSSLNAAGDSQRYAREFGIDANALQRARAKAVEQAALFDKQLSQRTQAQTSAIYSSLGQPKPNVETERNAQQQALRDHWWVQVRRGERWVDFDAAGSDSQPGRVITEANETRPFGSVTELPETLLHSVQLRVVLECSNSGKLTEHTLVESSRLLPSTLLGKRVAVQYVPVGWKPAPGIDKALLLKQHRWYPVLAIGSENIFDHNFTSACDIGKVPPGGLTGMSGSILGGFEALFGPSVNQQRGVRVTAQWLEYTIRVPGLADRKLRRAVFDVLGPATRASNPAAAKSDTEDMAWRLALLGETELLLLPSQLSPEYVEFAMATAVLAKRASVIQLVQTTKKTGTPDLSRVLPSPSGELYALAMARHMRPELSSGVYISQPNVLSYHRQLKQNDRGELGPLASFDIVANEVAVNLNRGNPYEHRLRQGVLDTNAEALLSTFLCEQSSSDVGCANNSNAAEAFNSALRAKRAWRLVRGAADLQNLPWPEAALARVREHLADGHYVLLPEQLNSASVTWWRIDAENGYALGFGEQGWGQATIQYALLQQMILNLMTYAWCGYSHTTIGAQLSCLVGFKAGTAASMIPFRYPNLKHLGWAGLILNIFNDILPDLFG